MGCVFFLVVLELAVLFVFFAVKLPLVGLGDVATVSAGIGLLLALDALIFAVQLSVLVSVDLAIGGRGVIGVDLLVGAVKHLMTAGVLGIPAGIAISAGGGGVGLRAGAEGEEEQGRLIILFSRRNLLDLYLVGMLKLYNPNAVGWDFFF